MIEANEFRTHVIWKTIDSLKASLAEFEDKVVGEAAIADLPPNAMVEQVHFIEAEAKRIVPHLISKSHLDVAASSLKNAQASIDQAVATPHLSYVAQAESYIETALLGLAPAPRHSSNEGMQAIAEAYASRLREQELRSSALKKETTSLYTKTKAIDQQVEEFKASVVAQKTRLDAMLAEFQTQFSGEQNKRVETFAEERAKLTTLQMKLGGEAKEMLVAFRTEHDSRLEEAREYMDRRKREIDDLYEAAGSRAVSSHYKEAAKKEGTLRFWFTIFAGVMVLVGVGLVGYLGVAGGDSLGWAKVAARLSAIGMSIYAAQFLARQANIHRVAETDANRRFLKLASLNSFIVSLPIETQQRVREELVAEFFAAEPGPGSIEPAVEKSLVDGLPAILKGVTELVTASRK